MRAVFATLSRGAAAAWNYVRAVMGDRAYERYVDVARRSGKTPLSAEAFYLDSLERRYSTVSRCC